MTMRHPLTLVLKETQPLDIKINNTCLLVQDLHSPFSDPIKGWVAERAQAKVLMREFDEYFRFLELIGPNIKRVLEAARDLGIRVVYSCLGHWNDEEPSPFQLATGWLWDLSGSSGDHPEAWAPMRNEPVFSKPGWSALANDGFMEYLSSNRIQNVIVVGTLLDFGVRQTSIDLSDRGIGSLILTDGTNSVTEMAQDYNTSNIAHGLIKLRHTGELLNLLQILKKESSILI